MITRICDKDVPGCVDCYASWGSQVGGICCDAIPIKTGDARACYSGDHSIAQSNFSDPIAELIGNIDASR
jgi:hypothetical protein